MKHRNMASLGAAVQHSLDRDRETMYRTWIHSVPDSYRGVSLDDCLSDLEETLSGGVTSQLSAMVHTRDVPSIHPRTCGSFLILRGAVGTGKTTLAVALVDAMIRFAPATTSGLYTTGVRALSNLSFEHREEIERLSTPNFLVVDDLGVVNDDMTDHQRRMLWQVMEHRWSHPRQMTVITTNMPLSPTPDRMGMPEWVGPAIWDRMTDRCAVFSLETRSRRGVRL